MGSQQWQWEESQWKSNNDQIVYHCRVRTNRDDLPWQATRIYDIPSDGHQALVRKTGLSPYRIYDWARVAEHRENNGYQIFTYPLSASGSIGRNGNGKKTANIPIGKSKDTEAGSVMN